MFLNVTSILKGIVGREGLIINSFTKNKQLMFVKKPQIFPGILIIIAREVACASCC